MTNKICDTRGLELHDGDLTQAFVAYARFVESHAASHHAPDGHAGEAPDASVLIAVIVAEIRRVGDLLATRRPDLGSDAIRDFRILTAAWADEVLIRLGVVNNGGVEIALCNTANAGEAFFLLVERIVDRRNANDISLGAVCLLMLLMGFQGHYIGSAGLIRLRHYIDALRSIVAREKVFNSLAEASTVQLAVKNSASRRSVIGIFFWVPPVRITVSVCAVLFLIAVSVLSVHWFGANAELEQSLRRATDTFSGGDR